MEIKEKKKVVFGIDLTEDAAQISYCFGPEEEVKTERIGAEEENFAVPVAAFRMKNGNRFVFGYKALEEAEKNGSEPVSHFLSAALEGNKLYDEVGELDPTDLIGRFLSWLLRVPIETVDAEPIALVVSVPEVTELMPGILYQAIHQAGIRIPEVRFVSHAESFYFYSMSQPVELWRNGVILFDYDDEGFEYRRLVIDGRTRPAIVTTEGRKCPEMIPFLTGQPEHMDSIFLEIAEEALRKERPSVIYLTGKRFEVRWERETLRFLCGRGRVFQGQNLYSKGACHAAMDAVYWSRLSRRYLFLDDDSLKQNVSIRCMGAIGRETQLPVIDAGISWYNAESHIEVLLGTDREVTVVLTGMMDGSERNVVLRLDWMPERPERASRIGMDFRFVEKDCLEVTITDLGFGDLFKSSGLRETERITL